VESIARTSEAATASVDAISSEHATARGRRWFTPPAGSQARLQLDLQRRARHNLRRHVSRAAFRFGVLVLADIGSFGVMRALIRAVRDQAVVGEWVARRVGEALPAGILNGWQYAAALFVALLVLGCYGTGDRRRDAQRLFAAAALATALPLWMAIWTRGLDVVLLQYSVTTTLVWLGLVAERWSVDWMVDRVRPAEQTAARTLFVGRAEDCAAVASTPAFSDPRDFVSVGFVDLRIPPAPEARGHLVELARVLHDSHAETVVVCGQPSDIQLGDIARAALSAGCQLLALPRGVDVAGVAPGIVWRHGQPLVTLTAPTLKGWQLVVKRAVDLVGAAAGLVIAAPLMAIVAIAVTLDSPGPVFFRQERVGTGGRRFRVLKFRTMVHGASDAAHRELVTRMLAGDDAGAARGQAGGRPVYKLMGDTRVTRLGRLLRRTSLDELPQLFNVLRGDMSLVGPRPPLPYEIEAYAHWQFDRLEVRPGITGLWQVSGRNLLTYRQMCELDVEYVRRWSLWLDCRILLRTLPVVLFNSGRAA
jgi:exopolysaccharide biosynthesis polyprenyl glycosylphosphotransferase